MICRELEQKANGGTKLEKENLCHECQEAHPTYFSGGIELCNSCAGEVGWIDVLEDY